jgi:hypothetical protein
MMNSWLVTAAAIAAVVVQPVANWVRTWRWRTLPPYQPEWADA